VSSDFLYKIIGCDNNVMISLHDFIPVLYMYGKDYMRILDQLDL